MRYIVYIAEIILLLYLLYYSFRHVCKKNIKQFKITTIVLSSFIVLNFIATMTTYNNFIVFLFSTYDSCKYFALIYYMLAIHISKNEFIELLNLLTGVVIMQTICAVCQYFGSDFFFDAFRGKYKIVSRSGNFRSIGMFPYGIELGNYSCILFALYYNFSKLLKNRGFYRVIEICLVICVFISGTRTSMAILAFIFIMSNINNLKNFIRTLLIIGFVTLIGISFVNLDEIIARTKLDLSIELPRTYYMKKGIEVWKDHPLFGIGYTTFASAKYRESTNDIIFDQYDAHKFDYANLQTSDSFMVELIPEYGVFGIMLIILYGRNIWIYYRKKQLNKEAYKCFVLVILSICMMSYNTSSSIFSSHIGSWFWITCGILLSYDPEEKLHIEKKKERNLIVRSIDMILHLFPAEKFTTDYINRIFKLFNNDKHYFVVYSNQKPEYHLEEIVRTDRVFFVKKLIDHKKRLRS